MEQKRELKIGDVVIYTDHYRVKHRALVTNVWSDGVGGLPGCNVVYVSGDVTKADPYGRQLERETSCIHLSVQPAGGNAWSWPDEG